ncbi:MAG TPA: asparagine synthase (glutamine-hydrolyzing) [Candidatus Limnocylindrales bacterium]|nr:asparagine synthase (glutamine-hydrolyzing) [Candidatus Limnocylindrales bacterium]
MCGIAGILSDTAKNLAYQIWPMLEAQHHRGPDDWGIWSDEICALGHRRLSIIDRTLAGRQPLSNEEGTCWVTFNGEIYNFQRLRQELEGLGHSFRTQTDTEVIVHAYEQWGTACVERFRGMFAFGLWDQRRRRLFLARDRIGKKPLCYTQIGNSFLFASELQGLLANPLVPREVDFTAIDAYLSWGYIPVPKTAFRNVYKLPPAHRLTLEATPSGFQIQVERYWSLTYLPKLPLGEEEAAEALREKLTEAVQLRLRSDVPLGAFLSGGIDSSIVVGLMAKLSHRPVKTFSIGFEEINYNELAYARCVAQRWNTDHHEFIVKSDIFPILPKLARHHGEPHADEASVPTFYLSQMTQTYVTVALNGDGGDENFAGYARYRGNQIAHWIHRIPGGGRTLKLLTPILPDSPDPKSPLRRLQRFLTGIHPSITERYSRWVGYFSEMEKDRLYKGDLRELLTKRRPEAWLESLFEEVKDLDPVEASMAVDVQSYLPFALLVKVDITSMANGLEVRSPFLDHEVMEFVAKLPSQMKLRGRTPKYLLKVAFKDILPTEISRRRKMGFGVPVGEWFRGPLRQWLSDTLLSQRSFIGECFKLQEINHLLTQHLDRQVDHSLKLWNLLMLELWYRELPT